MDKTKKTVLRAKFTYFFKETFRAHSKAEYREIFSRGLNDENGGITGTLPWLYVRAFFALLILFTINVFILRFTNNTLYVPSVTFLGGITFTMPFVLLLYELYPKRDLSMFMLIGILVGGGTAACLICQIIYHVLPARNSWTAAVSAGFVEEFSKMIPAILAIRITGQKNPYACFLIAAFIGAGFSIMEDMGYIFYYSDKYVFDYHSDIQTTISLFVDRGLTAFCTHILWTGAIGWAYSISKRPFRSVWLAVFAVSIALHVCWDLPFTGAVRVLVIIACIVVAAVINIAIVHKSRINTLAAEVDLKHVNEVIIEEAKTMGEQMRFTNAANLTFALTCALLSVIVLVLCSLPIGMEYTKVVYPDEQAFLEFVEDGYNLKADFSRKYNPYEQNNAEERYIDGTLTYVIQRDTIDGYDGVYYYEYYIDGAASLTAIYVELDDFPSRISCTRYSFGGTYYWAFDVNADKIIEYSYKKDGTVTALTDAEEFEGYNFLMGLCATGCALAAGCTIIIIAFRIKLWRSKNEGL